MSHLKQIYYLGVTLVLMSMTVSAVENKPATAKETIEIFYKAYLNEEQPHRLKRSEPVFSKAFLKLRKQNLRVCKEKAGSDICGWGADADPYLNAQDMDDDLTYGNAVRSITEPKPGEVHVQLDVFPSQPNEGDRTIVFTLIQEDKRWVVDDISLGDISAQRFMRDEIAQYEPSDR